MYSEQNFEDNLSSSDNSYCEYFDTTSKPTKPWIKVPVNNVKEKIKYFSENSVSEENSFDSFKKSGTKKKIINEKIPLELEKKLYTSRTEICHTRNGNKILI